jgi:hypothetical protein
MASINIAGDTSGVVTLQAPSVAGSTTLNLPATSGTLNTSGAVNVVPAGTTAAPAITTTGDTNTGIFFPAEDTIAFAEGGAEAMRINSSGNVGIGTSSPSSRIHVRSDANALTFIGQIQNRNGGASTGGAIAFINSTSDLSDNRYSYIGAITTGSGQNGNNLVFATNPNAGSATERMRIDSSGNVLMGSTSTSYSYQTNSFRWLPGVAVLCSRNTTGDVNQIAFFNPNGAIGSINTSGTSTTYNTSSDYRLKEDVSPMTGALDKVALLKPVTYTWKADGSDGQGFIAHELAEVVPDAVTGEKDAVDKDGKPVYQGVDTSFLVATLTKAIQEQQALIENLTTRLTALEGN